MKKIVSLALSVLVIAGAMGSVSLASASTMPPPGYGCSETVELDVPYYAATKDYYSGPATAVQTVSFLTGKEPLNLSLKQWCYSVSMHTNKTTGTTADNFLKVLNRKQDKADYKAVKISCDGELVNHIDQTLVQQVPVVVKAAFQNDQYSSQSHYMNVSMQTNMICMTARFVEYALTDPMCAFLNPENANNGTYMMTNYELCRSVMDDPDQTIFCCA